MKILIANRGEIALRIARTAQRLGHEVVGVTTDVDSASRHAISLNAITVPSYLDGAAIISAARESGCGAIHPGYGFLSENASFAKDVVEADLIWIGPNADVINSMGSKINARAIAESAGVPLIPGYSDSQAEDDLRGAADNIGYPVLIKASAGGGGRGIRIVESPEQFATALDEARTEAERAFGDGSVIVERYVQQPRHVEVQLIGDRHGRVEHLGTRECSVQRRYQKLFEEAPAPNLPDETRNGIHEAAVRLGSTVGYDSAGTVEFVVDGTTGEFFFLEMNTRLQVEHPVTEAITGLDLVELMINVASGQPLPAEVDEVTFSGHACEARIAAEDASQGFMPSIGTIDILDVPADVRWDSGVVAGSTITPHFDSMVAKLIVSGHDRSAALAAMRAALDELLIAGVNTTAGFHRWLVDRQELIDATFTTRLLDSIELPASPVPAVELAAALWREHRRGEASNVWTDIGSLPMTPHRHQRSIGLQSADGEIHEINDTSNAQRGGGLRSLVDGSRRRVAMNIDGHTHAFTVVPRTERWAADPTGRASGGNALVSPFPAVIAEVRVAVGDELKGGDVAVVIEAMKMLHSVTASGAATVSEVLVAVGDQVAGGQELIKLHTEND
ncbi:MAG: ATP-grasp domain-containing protein [Ilumatobacteraceae bacterium]|nr:ATP-grasp domain-containing protein [Ilumatobacteraceae bacterium]